MPTTPSPPNAPGKRAYHHGALREALIEATERLLAEQGPEGFSLREAARRAGVSPAAPIHHFGDARGLLTAVATRAFQAFGARLAAARDAATPDRRSQLRALGLAYVRFAIERPGGFDLMFRPAKLNYEDEALAAAAHAAFAVLAQVFEPGFSGERGPAESGLPAALSAWSIVHGFSQLWLNRQLPPAGPEGIEAVFDAIAQKPLDALLPD